MCVKFSFLCDIKKEKLTKKELRHVHEVFTFLRFEDT